MQGRELGAHPYCCNLCGVMGSTFVNVAAMNFPHAPLDRFRLKLCHCTYALRKVIAAKPYHKREQKAARESLTFFAYHTQLSVLEYIRDRTEQAA